MRKSGASHGAGEVPPRRRPSNYWPGYVDMLSTLLLVVTFLMSLFMLSNYFITTQTSGKDTMLSRLNRQLSAAHRASRARALQEGVGRGQPLRPASDPDRQGQGERAADRTARRSERQDRGRRGQDQRARAASSTSRSRSPTRRWPRSRSSISSSPRSGFSSPRLQEALDASEAKDKESQVKIADLGQRLNVALAKKVQELARYRSDFFGKLQGGSRRHVPTSRWSATASCSRPTCCSIQAPPISSPKPRRRSTSSPTR